MEVLRHRTLLLALAATLMISGCSREKNNEPRSEAGPGPSRLADKEESVVRPRQLLVTSWPDLGLPGSDMTVKVKPIPDDAVLDGLAFRLVADPCGGKLEQSGPQAVYHIPKLCEGGRILIEVVAPGSGSREVSQEFSFRVEGDASDMGSLMQWPLDGETIISPLQVSWDRTFLRKEGLSIDLSLERRGQALTAISGVGAEEELELDIPASPEPTTLKMCAGQDNCQKVELKIFKRRGIRPVKFGIIVDDFSREGDNLIGGKLRSLDPSRTMIRYGRSLGMAGEIVNHYAAIDYRRSPHGKAQGIEETLGSDGVRLSSHPIVSIWLRPGPLNEMPGKLILTLTSKSGKTWTRRISNRGAYWQEQRIDASAFVKVHSAITSLSLHIDETRQFNPAGTFHVGSISFLSSDVAEEEEEEPGRGEEIEGEIDAPSGAGSSAGSAWGDVVDDTR